MKLLSFFYFNKNSICHLTIIVSFLFLTSCIPTKKVVYLQGEENVVQELLIYDWEYQIRPGDRFYLKVTNPSLNSVLGGVNQPTSNAGQTVNIIQQAPSVHDYLVSEEGTIDYPLLGKIQASGKTITDFRNEIKEKCKGYITNPSINLFMTNYNVTILGEVNNSGFYQLITNKPTFFDAVGLANDLTDFANRKEVKIIRREGDKTTINYVDVTSPEFIQSPFYRIHPNDVIHIMPLKVKKYSSDNALPLILSVITTVITIISITSR